MGRPTLDKIAKRVERMARKDGETTPRTCLKCGQEFPSTGPGNRICLRCSFGRASKRGEAAQDFVGVIVAGVHIQH